LTISSPTFFLRYFAQLSRPSVLCQGNFLPGRFFPLLKDLVTLSEVLLTHHALLLPGRSLPPRQHGSPCRGPFLTSFPSSSCLLLKNRAVFFVYLNLYSPLFLLFSVLFHSSLLYSYALFPPSDPLSFLFLPEVKRTFHPGDISSQCPSCAALTPYFFPERVIWFTIGLYPIGAWDVPHSGVLLELSPFPFQLFFFLSVAHYSLIAARSFYASNLLLGSTSAPPPYRKKPLFFNPLTSHC